VTVGDVAVYNALYGARYAVTSSDPFAKALGFDRAPVDDLLVFHIVFGKTVPDVSLNAVANLGYAECLFLTSVYPGDTLSAESEVVGVKENSSGKTGVVYMRTKGLNQNGAVVLSYARWVMVNKRDPSAPAPAPAVPEFAEVVDPGALEAPLPAADVGSRYDYGFAGALHAFDDYEIGERIDHVDGVTLEEAEHQMATRLYQNTAKVHFNELEQSASRFGRRLVYGGVVISLVRTLAFNGLENAFRILAINGGRHVAPTFAGDTVSAWSEVLDKRQLGTRDDVGAVRLRTIGLKNQPSGSFAGEAAGGKYEENVVVDLDYWVLIPR